MAFLDILFFSSLLLSARGDFESVFKSEILALNSSISDIGQCGNDLVRMVSELQNTKNFWALKMLDATSKIRSGFAVGSDDIGQFDECVGAASDDGKINGKYCLGHLDLNLQELYPLRKTKHNLKQNAAALTETYVTPLISWAACLPSSCSAGNFEIIFYHILDKCTPDLIQHASFDELSCYTINDDTKLTTGAVITIVFLSLMLFILILATCYDIYCQQFSKAPNGYLLAFSMYTNSKKLFTMSKNNNQLECLNGLKFYSMLWVVVGHTYSLGTNGPLYNHMDLEKWADKLHSMLVVSGTLSVDTFFLVGGALVSYVYMQSMVKGKKFNILIYYLHRYLRLTPALAALVLVVATLYPYLGSGPNWMMVRANQKMCHDAWWETVFYFQNYWTQNGICLGHSWYLAVDMQLYILSPIILYSLKKFPKYTMSGLTAIVLGLCLMNFGLAWTNEYPAILSNIYKDNIEFTSVFSIKTHTRANVWIIGIMIGYVIHQIKQKEVNFRLNKILNLGIWIFTLVLLLICIFVGHDSLRTPEYQHWGNSLHIAFCRPCWALGICWIMISCISGSGGPINWFLSLPVYQVFNRFAYSIYLVHYMLINLWVSSIKSPIFFSDLMMGYFFWGNLCFTCIISYFWVLAFESPVIILEKLILDPLLK